MKRISFVFAFLLIFLRIAVAQAALYSDPESELLFEFPDGYAVQDESTGGEIVWPAALHLIRSFDVGQGVFEVGFLSTTASKALEELQLREISTTQLVNREVLGKTAVELIGADFTSGDPRRALVLGLDTETLVIIYTGHEELEYEAFVRGLRLSGGFIDVAGISLQKEIEDVTTRGIFQGYQSPESNVNEFKPQQLINRAEFLKVLTLSTPGIDQQVIDDFYARTKLPLGALQDLDRTAWFTPYVAYAFAQGWVDGYPDGNFRPGDPVNIAEAVKVITRSRNIDIDANLEVWFQPFLNVFLERNILYSDGNTYQFTFTDESFLAHHSATRAHVAGFLSRLIWLDEHTEFRRFVRLESSPEFSFSMDPEALIYSLGMGEYERSTETYRIFRGDDYLVTIHAFLPEVWKEIEKGGATDPSDGPLLYLGASHSLAYAFPRQCYGPQACAPDQFKETFAQSFEIKD
ncbi:MAG: S-layer homology domain-containing protein [bacterium]|nr:S-layer homology domain-containing protein [bacterium]